MEKTAIVTGASRGIGKAIALELAQRGYRLTLIATNKELLDAVAKECPTETLVCPLDVTDYDAIDNAVRKTFEKFGSINVLVNGSGIMHMGTSELTPENFSQMIDVNLKGTFNLTHAVIPYMKKQGSGYIFNISSRAGKSGIARLGGYSASKFGVCGLNDALINELTGLGIKLTAICPGWVNTDMADNFSNLASEDRIALADITRTVSMLLDLSPQTCIREVLLECKKTISK